MMEELKSIIKKALDQKASDLYLSTNTKIFYKKNGQLAVLDENILDKESIENYLKNFLSKEIIHQIETDSSTEFSYEFDGVCRARINIFTHLNGLACAFHFIPDQVADFEDLGLHSELKNILDLKSGLVLFTGPSDCGKTTTLASIINEFNKNKKLHIISLESPIEFKFKNINCLIHQREINTHLSSITDALKSSLHCNPDIIVISELNDIETISMAINLSKTGHLVLATMHSSSVTDGLEKIFTLCENEKQTFIRNSLAGALKYLVYQELMEKEDSLRKPIFEILINNQQVSSIIRQNNLHQIRNIMQLNNMPRFEDSE